MFGFKKKTAMPARDEVLPGRDTPVPVPERHYVNNRSMTPPFPDGMQQVVFGLGCFWGAERRFWETEGVYTTAVGYAAGSTPNPTYEEVCTGLTGHNEVVLVIYDPERISFEALLAVFWEAHDPTQGMRQGNDVGTQYRSGIYTYTPEQHEIAIRSVQAFQGALAEAGIKRTITTEIKSAPVFYYAESYHQQYLAKNPGGYCGLGGLKVGYPQENPA